MTSSQAHCAGDEPVSALSKAYEHFFELNFSTGEFAMSIVKILKQVLVVLLCVLLVEFTAQVDAYGSIGQSNDQPAASPAKQSPHELQQLVAPIALYPDALVAQILAASTYPTQIVEADRWMQGHSNLKGEELAKEVDKQDWDPSVKAVAQFPSVLENMDKNLSWASSLGDAYISQPQDVTDAVQTLRQQARHAGNLNGNEQEKVSTQGSTIVIEPANPDVVYVPAYDPWLVYGAPIVAYPGWYPSPGFIGAASALALVLDLVSAFSEDLGGAGATGDMTGTADERSSTITPSSHIAMSSVTRDSIMAISATVAPTAADSMGLRVFTGARASTEVPAFTRSRERALGRSVALITAAMCEGFHPRAVELWRCLPRRRFPWWRWRTPSVVTCTSGRVCREIKNGEEYHAARNFDFCST